MADPPDVVAVPVGAFGRRPASCLSVRSLKSKEADWIAMESGAVGEVRHITPVSHGLRLRSIPGVFAAGDCTAIPFKQIVVAQGAGATAGLSAWDHLIRTQAVVPA